MASLSNMVREGLKQLKKQAQLNIDTTSSWERAPSPIPFCLLILLGCVCLFLLFVDLLFMPCLS
jgi:hypothetical protein